MILNPKKSKLSLGDGLFRFKVVYETDECEPFSAQGLREQKSLLQTFCSSPELHFVGGGRFEQLRMIHSGSRWTIEIQKDATEQ